MRGFLPQAQAGAPGPVLLETSADLIDWTPLATNASPAGVWSVVDPTTGLPRRFYRVRRP